MKLSKRADLPPMEMDMTPMIDCVFQLITFFMLITDMSQRELEVLYLPIAVRAQTDKPTTGEMRPVVNIVSDGRVYVRGKVYYDPQKEDGYKDLRQYLSDMARRMPRKPLDEKNPKSPLVPDNALLIRADRSTPFKHIQKVMELCGLQGIQIWKVELAAAEEPKQQS